MKKLVLYILLFLSLTSTALAASQAPVVGTSPPELSLPNLDGKLVSLQESLNQKPVILFFFTSWSKSCQSELKDLQTLYNDRVEIIGVALDKKSKELKTFVSDHGLTFPILVDKKLVSLDQFQVIIIPTTFCLNKNGKLDKIFVDYDDNVKKSIAAWLTGQSSL